MSVPAARLSAQAKVNLTLRVGPCRSDGYHELATIFARIGLADDVVVRTLRGGVTVTVRRAGVPDESAYVTARRLAGAVSLALSVAGTATDGLMKGPSEGEKAAQHHHEEAEEQELTADHLVVRREDVLLQKAHLVMSERVLARPVELVPLPVGGRLAPRRRPGGVACRRRGRGTHS